MLMTINAKTLANYENQFDNDLLDATCKLFYNCTQTEPQITPEILEKAMYNGDYLNKIKNTIYHFFTTELNIQIQSDDTNFNHD